MAKVKVLIEGYAKFRKDGYWKASSTVSLVESGKKKIIFDPGADRKALLNILEKEGLTVEDIDFVFISHDHADHSLLMGIFPKATVCNGELWVKGVFGNRHDGTILGKDIRIIKTPGHSPDHSCLLIKTDEGSILLAGDVFWWSEEEKQKTDTKSLLTRKDPFVKDQKELEKSRKKVLKIADWIIPGHGEMFRVKK